jgi:hypothetical protein
VTVSRPLITKILMTLVLLVTVLACSRGKQLDPINGYGIDGSGHEFVCGGGPVGAVQSDGTVVLSDGSVVEGGHSYATTEPGGRGTCIRPPTPSP